MGLWAPGEVWAEPVEAAMSDSKSPRRPKSSGGWEPIYRWRVGEMRGDASMGRHLSNVVLNDPVLLVLGFSPRLYQQMTLHATAADPRASCTASNRVELEFVLMAVMAVGERHATSMGAWQALRYRRYRTIFRLRKDLFLGLKS